MTQTMIFETKGNVELLSANRFAVFASRNTPEELIQYSCDVCDSIKRFSFCAVGGWQAKAEKKILSHIWEETNASVIHYLAKNLNTFSPNVTQQTYLDAKRLLFVAPPLNQLRPSHKEITQRDQLLFSQTRKIFFIHIQPGGRLEMYLNHLSEKNFTLFILDHSLNAPFFDSGMIKIHPDNAELLLG